MVQEFPLLGTIQVILPLVICLLMLFCTNCSFLLGPPLFSSSVLQSLLWLCYDHNLTLLYGFFLPVLLFFFFGPYFTPSVNTSISDSGERKWDLVNPSCHNRLHQQRLTSLQLTAWGQVHTLFLITCSCPGTVLLVNAMEGAFDFEEQSPD